MNRRHLHADRQRGSITVFFLLFAVVLVGAITYSLYFAHMVNEKARLEMAADAETHAMATHAATGLNMIAANNLAIGASLHIAGAMPIISRYIALTRSAMSTCADIAMNGEVLAGGDGAYQRFFKWFAPISKVYLRTASGLTTINRAIAHYWLAPAVLHGFESLRLNAPGAISLPLQISQVGKLKTDPTAALFFSYGGLRQTFARETFCHAISASDKTDGRDNPFHWLGGPLISAGGNADFGSVADSMQSEAEEKRRQAEKDMADAEEQTKHSCDRDPFKDGGVVDKKRCDQRKKMLAARKNMQAVDDGGLFSFGSCGVGGGLNYGEQAAAHFSDQEDSIGFVYPDPGPSGTYDAFQKSINFATLAGLAFRVKDEQSGACPAEWQQTIDGKTVCQPSALWTYEKQNIKTEGNEDFNLAVGGMVELLENPDSLKSGWQKTKWALSQARAYYHPSDDGEDPPQAKEESLTLFWPAWQAKTTKPTLVKELTGLLFGS
jgi:hypothetical protein